MQLTICRGSFPKTLLRLAFGLACCDVVLAQPDPGWSFVAHRGAVKVVTLERQSKAGLEERVWAALRSVCTKSHCNAHFYWEDEYASRKALPERELMTFAVLTYSTTNGFQWNCTLRPFADNCFKK